MTEEAVAKGRRGGAGAGQARACTQEEAQVACPAGHVTPAGESLAASAAAHRAYPCERIWNASVLSRGLA